MEILPVSNPLRLLIDITRNKNMTITLFINNTLFVLLMHSQSIQTSIALKNLSIAINFDIQTDKYV